MRNCKHDKEDLKWTTHFLIMHGQTVGSGSSSGGGGLTPEEHGWLESLASMPARGDVNAEKTTVVQCALQSGAVVYFPIIGYDKISTAHLVNVPSSLKLCTSTGDVVSSLTIPSGSTVWSNYEDIPSNAAYLKVTASNNLAFYYSFPLYKCSLFPPKDKLQ